MNERRVVITGIGCISPLGNDLTTTWEGLKAGRSGISRITSLDPEPFDCKIAGEVKNFEADGYFRVPKDARRADRYVQLAVAASKMAVEDSGLDVSAIDPRRFGVMVGSGIGHP
jgi:3-oxoacyl-[acyl-carrier-protein] synthase II